MLALLAALAPGVSAAADEDYALTVADLEAWEQVHGTIPEGAIVDMDGNPLEKIQPGMIARMTVPGTITGVGPNVPGSDSLGWLQFIERSISIGTGQSYESVSRDYSRGTFSSTRASMNADKKVYRRLQKFAINHFGQPTHAFYAKWAAMRGVDGFPTVDVFLANIEEFLDVTWSTPGWDSVNPWDDARAAALEIKHGLSSRSHYHGQRGRSTEQNDRLMRRDQESAERNDLLFNFEVEEQDTSVPGENQSAT